MIDFPFSIDSYKRSLRRLDMTVLYMDCPETVKIQNSLQCIVSGFSMAE